VNYQIALNAVSPLSANWQRLLLGWGWSNFYLAWDSSYLPHIEALDPLLFDRAHNFYLDLLVMCGLMGPAAFALLAWRIYQSTFAMANGLVRAGLFLIFTTHLVEYLFNFDSVSNLISNQVVLSNLVHLRLGRRE
jgi:O-antigen ligase